MRLFAGVVLALAGTAVVVVTITDQPMPRGTLWWWRFGRPVSLVAFGVALILVGARVAGGWVMVL